MHLIIINFTNKIYEGLQIKSMTVSLGNVDGKLNYLQTVKTHSAASDLGLHCLSVTLFWSPGNNGLNHFHNNIFFTIYKL